MIIEKSLMKTEAKFSDDRVYRYVLSKEWNNKKPRAMVIMTNPSSAGEVVLDLTTLYTINNLVALDYGAVDIFNMYPMITQKLRADDVDKKEIENSDKLMVELAEKVDTIIIAWGRVGEKSKSIEKRQNELLHKLQGFKEKLYIIGDGKGNELFHPLAPHIRFHWELIKFDYVPVEKEKKGNIVKEKVVVSE